MDTQTFDSLPFDIRQRTQELDSLKGGPGSGRHKETGGSKDIPPKVLYHFTTQDNSSSIDKSGLVAKPDYILTPDDRAGVNMVESKDSDTPPPMRNETIYKIDASKLDQSKFWYVGNDWWRYHGDVPIEHVKQETKSLKATPQLSAFVWNPYERAYVPVKGKSVDTSATRKIVDEVRRGSQERLAEAALKLQSGELTNLTQFSIDLKDELRNLYTTTHILARGGLDEMDAKAWGMLGQSLKEQYSYANSMVRDIENGNIGVKDSNGEVVIRDSGIPELSDGFLNRVDMYTESAWGAAGEFEAVVRDREMELGSLERRVLGDSKVNCDECIELANRDWQPPGLMPDIGETECQTGCNCEWEFENQELDDLAAAFGHPEIGAEGDEPLPQPEFTLHPDESS